MRSREYEECEYCWKRATRERWIDGQGRWAYCKAHAPADATVIKYDTDGSLVRMAEETEEAGTRGR